VSERLVAAAFSLALALVAAPAAAGAVPDPTRPAVMPTTTSAESAPVAALVLQSTLVSPRQRSAIINGQRYRLGAKVGDARLEAIGAGWVRLRGATGATELRLSYPVSTRPVNR
jgi:hypothetical protein